MSAVRDDGSEYERLLGLIDNLFSLVAMLTIRVEGLEGFALRPDVAATPLSSMSAPARYRMKPVTVEAFQFDGYNSEDIEEWSNLSVVNAKPWKKNYGFMDVKTPEGVETVSPGDFVICNGLGDYHRCPPGLFAETYEAIRSGR